MARKGGGYMTNKEEIELLKAKIKALELEIEIMKAKDKYQPYIPYPYPYVRPWNPWEVQVWYGDGQTTGRLDNGQKAY